MTATVLVPLTQGKVAIIDAEDAACVLAHKWHALKPYNTWYARNSEGIYLHRLVMGAEEGIQIDHINLNGLDCRKENLRRATNARNNQNKGKHPNNTSGYKGVYWSKVRGKWMAYISVNGKRINLGYYDDLEYASRVYDQAAREHHGEFARLNFPDENIKVETSTGKIRRDSGSGFRGVVLNKERGTYRAYINEKGVKEYLGSFADPKDAARAYNERASTLFGENARLNSL